jgi:hypothetical protein
MKRRGSKLVTALESNFQVSMNLDFLGQVRDQNIHKEKMLRCFARRVCLCPRALPGAKTVTVI